MPLLFRESVIRSGLHFERQNVYFKKDFFKGKL